MKSFFYSLLLAGCLLMASCHKSSTGPTIPPAAQKEYLVTENFPGNTDTLVFLYTNDTVLRGYANEVQINSVPLTSAFFCQVTNGQLLGMLAGADTIGDNTSQDYAFEYDGNGRVLIASYYQSSSVVDYDSLVYNSAGNISLDYNFSGAPGSGVLNTVASLTWDASGDLTQMLIGDSLNDLATTYTQGYVFTYDNEVNPYITNHSAYMIAIGENHGWEELSPHNVLTSVLTQPYLISSQSTTQYQTNTYTYDALGYPTTSTQVNAQGSYTQTVERTFTYFTP